nr:hypothetical protein [Aeromonas dhakensis]
MFGVDASLAHGPFQATVTGDHFSLLLGEIAYLLFGLFHGAGHGLGRLLYLGKLLGHLLGIALGCCELGAGGTNLLAEGTIAINLATLGFQFLDALFRFDQVFGCDTALSAGSLEWGGELVDRPEQDLKFERVHCSVAPLMRL